MDDRKRQMFWALACAVFTIVFTMTAVKAESLEVLETSYTFSTYDEDLPGFNAAITGLQSTVLNFDELNNGTKVTDLYYDEGVSFSSLVVCCWWSGVSPSYPTARYGNHSLSGSNPVSYPIGLGVPWDSRTRSELRVAFSSGTSFAGAHFIDNSSPIIVRAFDINDEEIGVFSVSKTGESGNSGEWWGVVTDGRAIARMTFTAASRGDFFAIDNFTFQSPAIVADIDIKPGSDPNSININSRGVIPVAVLTTDEFDARDVNAGTVRFGPAGAYAEQYALEDVDDDGDLDLILHFRTRDAGIAAGDAEAVLTGETLDGLRIEGSDSVRVLERKRNKNK